VTEVFDVADDGGGYGERLRRLLGRIFRNDLLGVWVADDDDRYLDDSQPSPVDAGHPSVRGPATGERVAGVHSQVVWARRCGCCMTRPLWRVGTGVSCDFCDMFPTGDDDAELAVLET
jgi:hypothetical protein